MASTAAAAGQDWSADAVQNVVAKTRRAGQQDDQAGRVEAAVDQAETRADLGECENIYWLGFDWLGGGGACPALIMLHT